MNHRDRDVKVVPPPPEERCRQFMTQGGYMCQCQGRREPGSWFCRNHRHSHYNRPKEATR
jgi:hypothetical protein